MDERDAIAKLQQGDLDGLEAPAISRPEEGLQRQDRDTPAHSRKRRGSVPRSGILR